MKKRSLLLLFIVLYAIGLASCHSKSKKSAIAEGDTLQLNYAKLLTIVNYDDYTKVDITNPWDTTQLLKSYLLVNRAKPVPSDLPKGTLVKVPLKKSVIYSAVHCSLVEELGALQSIGGVCDKQYINHEPTQRALESGDIMDLGSSMAPNIELLVSLNPDALLLSPFENSGHGRVAQMGVPIIECADYMENTPLGRAEWMRFYGLLFGVSQRAESMFKEIADYYHVLCDVAAGTKERPTVISELKTGSAWYVPGGKSWMSIFYENAGADYVFAEDNHTGSIPLSPETVLSKAKDVDFWLIKYNQENEKSYQTLKEESPIYSMFKAYREGNIYLCNTRYVNFYEEIPFHPDRFLKDLIKIFHPELLSNYELKFYSPLK